MVMEVAKLSTTRSFCKDRSWYGKQELGSYHLDAPAVKDVGTLSKLSCLPFWLIYIGAEATSRRGESIRRAHADVPTSTWLAQCTLLLCLCHLPTSIHIPGSGESSRFRSTIPTK